MNNEFLSKLKSFCINKNVYIINTNDEPLTDDILNSITEHSMYLRISNSRFLISNNLEFIVCASITHALTLNDSDLEEILDCISDCNCKSGGVFERFSNDSIIDNIGPLRYGIMIMLENDVT